MSEIEQCPKTIAAAIHGIMSDIKTLQKIAIINFKIIAMSM